MVTERSFMSINLTLLSNHHQTIQFLFARPSGSLKLCVAAGNRIAGITAVSAGLGDPHSCQYETPRRFSLNSSVD